ncbi:hypothetical protein HYT05_05170, partial [Candidatus Kaiserbacteria bacterium]|nr:hypothetical protein [Candidatus Kaiserbacteria bacterium]
HIQTPHLLQEYGVKPARIPQVLEEARQLCGIQETVEMGNAQPLATQI